MYFYTTTRYANRPPHGSSLDTFWRSVENVSVSARRGMLWAVSQAAPLRRVRSRGDLRLTDGGAWASGGVAANCAVEGRVDFGGQQQWLMRNVELRGGTTGGAWNLVFVGCTHHVPEEYDGMAGGASVTVEAEPEVRVEKPYVIMASDGAGNVTSNAAAGAGSPPGQLRDGEVLQLRVPRPTFGKDAVGIQHDGSGDDTRDFSRVLLAVPSTAKGEREAARHNSATIQRALDEGKDVVLSPGVYPLAASVTLRKPGQVLLGLGYATLLAPREDGPCVVVPPGLPGVRLAGLMLEASSPLPPGGGPKGSPLLRWGSPAADDPGDPARPGVLSDVFVRVGAMERDASAGSMVELHSGHLYGDNLWLWRADHVALRPGETPNFPNISQRYRQTVRGECAVRNGLVVHAGAVNVTIAGLAVEHATEDQTVWRGEGGRVHFYQCELPYDADASFAARGFVGYRVDPDVARHAAAGVGVYSNFRDHDVRAGTAVAHPVAEGVAMRHMFTVKLDNLGGIKSVANGRGPGPTEDTPRGTPLRCPDGCR